MPRKIAALVWLVAVHSDRWGRRDAPAIAAYNPTGDFTIEGRVYPTALGGYQTVAAHWDTTLSGAASYDLDDDPASVIAERVPIQDGTAVGRPR